MKITSLLLLGFSLFLVACGDSDGESANVDIIPTVTRVTNAGEGTSVPDPSNPRSSEGELQTISLKGGYFSFLLFIKNKSSDSVAISSIDYELLEYGSTETILGKGSYSPASIFIGSHPRQDLSQRYMILVPGKTELTNLFGISPTVDNDLSNITLFYIDQLERDDVRDYLYNVRLTVNGFFTSVPAPNTSQDPFQGDLGRFKKIVFFTIK